MVWVYATPLLGVEMVEGVREATGAPFGATRGYTYDSPPGNFGLIACIAVDLPVAPTSEFIDSNWWLRF